MRKALFALGALALAAVLVIGLLQAGSKEQASATAPEPLSRAQVLAPLRGAPPELAALHRQASVLLDGGTDAYDRQLRALRGRPVVVNLWASWCAPCRFELPYLQRQAAERGKRVAFLGINVGDERGAAREMAAEFPMPYPSFEDPDARLLDRFGAQGLPVTAFYTADGELAFVHQGLFPSEQALSDAIERYALTS